jgi:hypothetical protein
MDKQVHHPVPGPEWVSEPPEQVALDQPEGVSDPTSAAFLKITIIGNTSVEARGQVPMTAAVGIGGIFSAVVTSYLSVLAPSRALLWFLGLAAAELAVAILTIIRIPKADRKDRHRQGNLN